MAISLRKPMLIAGQLFALTLSAGLAGVLFNQLRPQGLALVAPFPYVRDCPEKLDLSGQTTPAVQALKLRGRADVLLVDARPAELFAAGHIDGARSLPLSFIAPLTERDVAPLTRFAHVMVYCDSEGDQLAQVQAQRLRELGLKSVSVLAGGIAAYRAAAARAAPSTANPARR